MESLPIGKTLQSFIAAFRKTAKEQGRQDEQDRYSFYEVPKSEVDNLSTAVRRKFEGDDDPLINHYLKEFRVRPSELEKRKIERHEVAWEALKKAGIELKSEDMENIMHGIQPSSLYLVDIQTPDGLSISTPMGIAVTRDDNDKVNTTLISPKTIPEFDEPQYRQVFSKEDKMTLMRGGQPERLFPMANKKTGEIEWCAVSYCRQLGRLCMVPASEIKAPAFWDGVKLTQDQKDTYEHAGRIALSGCTDIERRKYDCTLQYDALTQAPKKVQSQYAQIYIYPSLEKQLNEKELAALKNYEAISAANIKKKDGTPMTCSHIWIDPNTNKPDYGDLEKMRAQKYRYEKSQGASNEQRQEQTEEKTFRRSRGRSF